MNQWPLREPIRQRHEPPRKNPEAADLARKKTQDTIDRLGLQFVPLDETVFHEEDDL